MANMESVIRATQIRYRWNRGSVSISARLLGDLTTFFFALEPPRPLADALPPPPAFPSANERLPGLLLVELGEPVHLSPFWPPATQEIDTESAVELISLSAFDFLLFPLSPLRLSILWPPSPMQSMKKNCFQALVTQIVAVGHCYYCIRVNVVPTNWFDSVWFGSVWHVHILWVW